MILDVGGKAVATPDDVRDAIGDAHKNGKRTVAWQKPELIRPR